MSLFKKTTEQSRPQAQKKVFGKSLVNYNWIVKHFVFFMFLASLATIYIANGHWADNTIREINTTAKQVKEMEYEYKNLKSIEMFRTRESQVREAAAVLGLKPAAEPPVKLHIQASLSETEKPTDKN